MTIVAPSPTSVYKYRDDVGILIYVGITGRGMRRQSEHNDSKDWWSLVVSQEVEHFDSRGDALARERELIQTHTPPFNTQHNPRHREMRAAYMEYRVASSVRVSLPDAIGGLHERHLELDQHPGDHQNSVLRTRLNDAQIAMALELDEPVRAYGFSKVASVNRIEKVGPIALLHLTRRMKKPLMDAHAVIRSDEKRPLSVARIRVVQIRCIKEVAA